MNIIISELNKTNTPPYELLLLADASKKNIDNYIFNSSIYVAEINEELIGCYVLCKASEDTLEIKNIAVAEQHQEKGIGATLLRDAIEKAREQEFKKIIIGTGNSSVGQLYLYQKAGFRITNIIPDFFTNNYDEPIMENGIACVDMIVLTKEL